MPTDDTYSPAHDEPSTEDDVPTIEDAQAADVQQEETVFEDDPQLLSRGMLEADAVVSDEATDEVSAQSGTPLAAASDKLEASDVGTLADEPLPDAAEPSPVEELDWEYETSTHRLVMELKQIETEVRTILESRDSRRKRKLGGSRRWLELEEDIITWRYSGRFDEPTLRHLQELVTKRHYLFRRLRFIAGTRPTWNT